MKYWLAVRRGKARLAYEDPEELRDALLSLPTKDFDSVLKFYEVQTVTESLFPGQHELLEVQTASNFLQSVAV